jgi:hypothetical protein
MKRYVERWIGCTRDREHEVDGRVEAIKLDAEMRECAIEPDPKHTMRARSYRLAGEQ